MKLILALIEIQTLMIFNSLNKILWSSLSLRKLNCVATPLSSQYFQIKNLKKHLIAINTVAIPIKVYITLKRHYFQSYREDENSLLYESVYFD